MLLWYLVPTHPRLRVLANSRNADIVSVSATSLPTDRWLSPFSEHLKSPARRAAMPTFASTPTPLDRRISLALAYLRAARYDSNPCEITALQARMDALLERIACRPLAVIDPAMDERLSVH